MDKKLIKNLEDIIFYEQINLEKFTTIKLSNSGSLIICKSVSGLQNLFREFPKLKFHLVGWGANQVLLNTDKTIFLKLDFSFDKSILSSPQEVYNLPASVSLNVLTSHAIKYGVSGWEVFTGVPASLGGAIVMNAGTSLGEIGDLVKSVVIINREGDLRELELKPKDFNYRSNSFLNEGDVVVSAALKHNGLNSNIGKKIQDYLEYRKETQPLRAKTCGSVFKNINKQILAGKTMDLCGFKGMGSEKLFLSHKHANFIEHHGDAGPEDFKELIECLKIDTERLSGHKFELEVKVY